ncbi:Uncharacterised protein [Mycobacteroides abscessus subsp. abscessus]|nr:Uncharacterised protein [Mycobacteroides abscessus subsp. abscessus]
MISSLPLRKIQGLQPAPPYSWPLEVPFFWKLVNGVFAPPNMKSSNQ